ncbi:melatonin receptor type 1B-B-like isoform X2 [Neocloeon triangulifer]|nr:melatonin receptor type 1B-B-like isoform X2 [Neocloeon triangulifer]
MDGLWWNLGLVCSFFCAVIGTLGNCLTFSIFIFFKEFRDSIGLLIMGLTISDLLTSLVVVPLNATFFIAKGKWWLGKVACYIDKFLSYGSPSLAIILMSFIAINRWVKMTKPKETYKKLFSKRSAKILLAISPFIAFFPITLAFFDVTASLKYNDGGVCSVVTLTHSSILTFCIFGTNAVVIIFCYVSIYFKVRRHDSTMAPSFHTSMRFLKMVMATAMSFFICFTPVTIFVIISGGYKDNVQFPAVKHFLHQYPYYFSVILNPVIYGVMNRRYREAYLAVLRKTFPCFSSN